MKEENIKFSVDENGANGLRDYLVQKIEEKIKDYCGDPIDGVSVIFLAGASGSGKTEFVETVLDIEHFYLIDIDIYRNYFEGYCGENANEYQSIVNKVADKMFSYCLKNNINVIFDGTFRSMSKVRQNLDLCNKKGRQAVIFFIFQNPFISYYYTFIRKIHKSRNVPINVFIESFYQPIKNVFEAKELYSNLKVYVCIKKFREKKGTKTRYFIDDNIKDINEFCLDYNIGYNGNDFIHKGSLSFRVLIFDKLLKLSYNTYRLILKPVIRIIGFFR